MSEEYCRNFPKEFAAQFQKGEPNLVLPLSMAAGEFLKGVPLALVETPPGSM